MSEPGRTLRRVFEDTLLDLKGVDVFIYENWQSEQMSSTEARAMKERGKQFFEFPLGTRVKKGDVVQIKCSQDFWRVLDTEEEYKFGTAVKLYARVIKIDQAGNEIRLDAQGRAVYYTTNIGTNYGGVQQGGQGNVQNVTLTNNPDFERVIAGLAEVVKASNISQLDKDDIIHDVERVKQLAQQRDEPKALENAQKRLDAIKTGIEVADSGGELIGKALPYITAAWQFLTTLNS